MESTAAIVDVETRYRQLHDDPRRSLVAFIDASLELAGELAERETLRAHHVLLTAIDVLHDPPAPEELAVATELLELFEQVAGRVGDVDGQLEALERQRRARQSADDDAAEFVGLRRRAAAVLAERGRVAEALVEVLAGVEEAAAHRQLEVFAELITDVTLLLAAGGADARTVGRLEAALGSIRREARTDAWVMWSLVGLAAVRLASDDAPAARLYVRRLLVLADRMILPAVAGLVMAELSIAEREVRTAIQICDEILPLADQDPGLRRLVLSASGRAAAAGGDMESAVVALEACVALGANREQVDRTELVARSELADLYAVMGRFQPAFEQLRSTVSVPEPIATTVRSVDLRDRVVPRMVRDDRAPSPAPPPVAVEPAVVEPVVGDQVTGLIGRADLCQRLATLLAAGTGVTVMSIGVDRFGRLNETFGHAAGDQLLVEIARRLTDSLHVGDHIARWGGDEFMVVVPGLSDRVAGKALADGLRQVVAAPWSIDDVTVVPSVTIGVALSGDGVSADELVRQADAAALSAKRVSVGRVDVFSGALGERSGRAIAAEALVRTALDEGWFELFFQPIHSNRSGRPDGAEALLRIRHPERGIIPPLDFLDVIEEVGLGSVVGRWVIDSACAALARWGATNPSFRMSVNVAPSQLDADLPRVVADALRRHGASPAGLVIELTEHTLLEANDAQVAVLEAVRALGVRIALDDFGTAYSSLHHLRRFPVDVVKVDRSFVAGISDQPHDVAIVRAIVDLSRVIGFRVIAEGVETAEQLDIQERIGCFGAQGFLIGRPQTASDFDALMADVDRAALTGSTLQY